LKWLNGGNFYRTQEAVIGHGKSSLIGGHSSCSASHC
jgi:hypothetical protein